MGQQEPNDFIVYGMGICYASVCSSLPVEVITYRLNYEYPSGVSPWILCDEPFNSGEANPHPCEENPATHKHYLFNC